MNKSFKDKFLFELRKIMISIKRNYFVIPLLFVFVCAAQFMCNLYIMSPAFSRIEQHFMTALVTFVITLFVTLACVAYLNYALVKYGQKRPLHMLIIYFVLAGISLGLSIYLCVCNFNQLVSEINTLQNMTEGTAEYVNTMKYITLEQQAHNIVITQIVLQVITLLLVISAPFVQSALKKITFKKVDLANETK